MSATSSKNAVEECGSPFTPKTTQLLSTGILQFYQPSLDNVKKQLNELTEKQNNLIEQIHNENLTMADIKHSPELHDVFNTIKAYQAKLVNVKKDMKTMHERSIKLKKRALRVQQCVEKEAYLRSQQKEIMQRLEQDLVAKSTNEPQSSK